MVRSFPITFGNRGTIVDIKPNGGNEFKFSFNMPGCGCTCQYVAFLNNSFEDTDWEKIKLDLREFVKGELIEYTSESGKILSVNYCQFCGKKLPPINDAGM